MVDSELVNEVKGKLSAGETATPEDLFKLFEVYKQVSSEEQGLKAEFEDMDMLGMEFLGDLYPRNG